MNQGGMLIILLFFLFFDVQAQAPDMPEPANVSSLRPSLAVVIGILSIMFLITFLLIVYAKFCHSTVAPVIANRDGDQRLNDGLVQPRSRFSGIDKKVIESLPFFRFSSLRGSKEGLECAVCLSKFEDTEILRLLPKCKHAFHIDCIDQWLENHSSCPLCRLKVDVADLTAFTYSNSLRFLRNPSELTEDPNLDLFVQREEDNHGSSRFSIGGSFRKIEKVKKEELLIQEDDEKKLLHKFKHKIIVSDVVFKNRWSDANSSDLMFLNTEMLNVMSSKRFSSFDSNSRRFIETGFNNGSSTNEQIMNIKEEMERKRLFHSEVSRINRSCSISITIPSSSNSEANPSTQSRFLTPAEKRSVSDITNLSRFANFSTSNRIKESSFAGLNSKEERTRRLWFPIARRTVQWFGSKERRFQ
ncbi:hypothetical protein HHK36_021652 [Tetracentron sinense]|uniref:RING-type E3 ubiquitin transferase n=1 Tax=Tetracentron sinense TaxID=13715 RepID=A0A835D797_TETSI|nr:hypothetical protein HHK36_021652 [Tetracentron sinense]